MRKIKFRAWDKLSNKWLDLSSLFIDGRDGFLIVPDDQGGYLFDETDYVLMQYTGLKDKNGIQIYEGDICTNGKNIDFIKWEHSRWKFFVEDCLDCYNNLGRLEVIGNIYENPELLEV